MHRRIDAGMTLPRLSRKWWPSKPPSTNKWKRPEVIASYFRTHKTRIAISLHVSGGGPMGQGNGPAKTVAKPGRCQHRGKAFAGSSINFQKWTATSRGRLDARASHVERRASESTQEWTSTSQTGVTPSVERHASGAKSRSTLPNRGERRPNRTIATQVEIDQRTSM